MRKHNGGYLSKSTIEKRVEKAIASWYSKPKWIEFCEHFMEKGFKIRLYEARKTVSKYVTVQKGSKEFKVRFSNHKPIHQREMMGDCDFFVGVTHTGVRTTSMAIDEVTKFFQDVT